MSSFILPDLKQQTRLILSEFQPGYQVLSLPVQDGTAHMAAEVLAGLSKKYNRTLPCTYFYDARGSQLYEDITRLPEYYPTRTEAAMLQQIGPELQKWLKPEDDALLQIVELGSGSSTKTRLLLNALNSRPIIYIPIDVSGSMLTETAHELAAAYQQLSILGLAGEYEEALALLPRHQNRLFLFLGGTIGNFTSALQNRFFIDLARQMGTGAKLLLGFDRRPHANKPVSMIEAAYDDRQGVTAEFNLNILNHINYRLGGNFNLDLWQHQAVYNTTDHQIEMYLESRTEQTVTIDALQRDFSFSPDELILTEISRKFDPEELEEWFIAKGFECLQQWADRDALFGLMLLEVR